MNIINGLIVLCLCLIVLYFLTSIIIDKMEKLWDHIISKIEKNAKRELGKEIYNYSHMLCSSYDNYSLSEDCVSNIEHIGKSIMEHGEYKPEDIIRELYEKTGDKQK